MDDNFFESWNPDFFDFGARYQKCIRAFTSGLIKGDVLDLGCGSRVAYSLNQATSWTGVDISKNMSEKTRFLDNDSSVEKTFLSGDIRDIPKPDATFDTTIAMFVLHHLGEDDKKTSFEHVLTALKELYRVTKPGGTVIIAENAAGPIEWLYHALFPITYPVCQSMFNVRLPYFLTKSQLRSLAKDGGFAGDLVMNIPVEEKIYNPVLRVKLPSILSSDLFQKMTIYVMRK